ncbi:MAG: acyl-CoA dehydrogenase [Desulfobacteraceae bacterium 4572_123]|nr:MAG: acyl-CoA dehydrogenase [Desulfobacteraceae bacterium 4572_123]
MGRKIRSGEQLYFTKEHEMVRRSVRDFVNKEINPFLDEWEEKGSAPLHDLFKKMGGLGFLGIRYDPKYGGEGLDYWYELAVMEEFGHIQGFGLPIAIGVQTHMATPAIHEFGSEYLKETYLKPAIAGEMVTAIAVTEPGAGSDVGAIATTAEKDGDSYVINGSKTFITNGPQADYLTLLARTSDDPGYHCFSLFVVPTDLPGFKISRKLDKLGIRSSDTAELFFDNMRIPAENLIGREGEGFIYQMKQFQHERFSAMPLSYIAARDMIDITVEYIRKRIVFGKPLIKKQVLRHRLADWLTEIECMRHLTYHVTKMKAAGLDATREISMGKLFGSRLLRKVADGCLQMHGGMGFMNEMLISRYYRDARIIAIGAGADEVMSDVIAKLEGY